MQDERSVAAIFHALLFEGLEDEGGDALGGQVQKAELLLGVWGFVEDVCFEGLVLVVGFLHSFPSLLGKFCFLEFLVVLPLLFLSLIHI